MFPLYVARLARSLPLAPRGPNVSRFVLLTTQSQASEAAARHANGLKTRSEQEGGALLTHVICALPDLHLSYHC